MPEVMALRHVAFEDLGSWEDVLVANGWTARYLDVPAAGFSGEAPSACDLLAVLGGPIGVYEHEAYPFLTQEIAFIAGRLAARRPTIGICLGAQLIAQAAGGRVYPGPAKEIGWSSLTLSEAGRTSPLRHLECPVLHWHGDTFDLPPGAAHLASTGFTRNQAFVIGRHALALQFHPEVTAAGLEAWYVGHACEIAATQGISVGSLRAQASDHAAALAAAGRLCLEEWLKGAGL